LKVKKFNGFDAEIVASFTSQAIQSRKYQIEREYKCHPEKSGETETPPNIYSS
jgi:hypothetical protein